MLKAKYYIGSCVILSLLSCSKDKTYDIKGETDVKFFMNITSAGNAPQNSISYAVVNIPNVAGGGLINLSTAIPGNIKFPVYATRPVSADVVIGAQLDNSLIAAYNTAHGTNYTAFPAGILKTDGLAAHINKGATTSADSITIATDMTTINGLTEKTYMAPIRLATVSNPAAGGITNNTTTQVVYVVSNVEYRRIKYLAVAADALGTLITNRTTWTAIFNPVPATTGSIFDGSTTTFSRWTASPGQLDVNLQTTRNVTGIRLLTANSATNVPTQIEVSLSTDGINYDVIGSPLKANLTYASSYNYILFYKAIPAQYIRLKLSYVTSTNTQNYRVVEFDVYAN